MKKLIANIAVSALTLSGVLASAFSANATTLDDVVETARKYGIPETMIQQGFSEYYKNPDMYNSQDFDNAIYYIENYHQSIIDSFMGDVNTEQTTQPSTESEEVTQLPSTNKGSAEDSSEASSDINEENIQPETGSSEGTVTDNPVQGGNTSGNGNSNNTQQTPTASAGNSGNNSNNSSGNTNSSSNNTSSSNNNNSGNTNSGDRISQKDFINMTLEEKQAYVASLPEDERQAFMHSLSAEELKSIVKQLPVDDKAVIVDKFVEAGESMGIEVTVDEISDDNVSMIMKNEKGELIDIATVGVIVDDTGYDYRLIYSICGACIIAAAGGIWLVIRKCFAKDGAEK